MGEGEKKKNEKEGKMMDRSHCGMMIWVSKVALLQSR